MGIAEARTLKSNHTHINTLMLGAIFTIGVPHAVGNEDDDINSNRNKVVV